MTVQHVCVCMDSHPNNLLSHVPPDDPLCDSQVILPRDLVARVRIVVLARHFVLIVVM